MLTYYEIKLNPYNKEKLALLKKRLEDVSGYEFEVKQNQLDISNSSKWYEHPEHLVAISSENEFKDALITAHCECSEIMATWEFYAKNGKGYRQDEIVTIPEFDESKLSDDKGDW